MINTYEIGAEIFRYGIAAEHVESPDEPWNVCPDPPPGPASGDTAPEAAAGPIHVRIASGTDTPDVEPEHDATQQKGAAEPPKF